MKVNLPHLVGAALLYFAVVLWLAIGHYEAKFIMDGFSQVFTIANWETFSPALGRHVLLIQQVVPVLFAKLGAGIRTIMLAYVIWDVLFYTLCFLFTLLMLKDKLASLLIVSVHVFGMYYNHFMMVGELHPGAMFAIITLSALRNWDDLGKWKWLITGIAAFFTVSSHPLALVSFVVAAVILSTEKRRVGTGVGWQGLMVLLVLMMILKLLLLHEYDGNTVSNTVRTPMAAVMALFAPSYLSDYLLYYLLSSPVVSVLSLAILVYGIRFGMWMPLGLWALFLLVWSVVAQQYLDFTFHGLHSVTSMMHNRYLFPMKFVTLSFFILQVLPRTMVQGEARWWPRATMALWFVGFPFLWLSSRKADRTIDGFKETIQEARAQGLTKSCYAVSDYCGDAYIHRGSFFATLVLSNMDDGTPCHVIHAPDRLVPRIGGLRDDEILLMEEVVLRNDELNPRRFSLPQVGYEPLDYACDRVRLGED